MRKKVKYIKLLIYIILLTTTQVKGQDFPWSLQYITNMYNINPAYVGMWERGGFMLSTRTNWIGINGAPFAQQFAYNTPIKNQRSGIGFSLERMNIGKEKRFTLTADYSYQLRLNMYYFLRFGLRVGIMSLNNNLKDYSWYPDQIVDPESLNNIEMVNMSVVGIGTVLYSKNYYISFSIPNKAVNTFNIDHNLYSYMPEIQTMYLSGGYIVNSKKSVILRPNLLLIYTKGKQIAVDAAVVLYFPGNLQAGVNLRSNGAMCISGQYTFRNSLRIGYASEYFIIPDISKYQMGSYEFFVGYDFNLYKRKNIKPNYF